MVKALRVLCVVLCLLAASAAVASAASILVQAEDMTLSAPEMAVGEDPTAFGGKYLAMMGGNRTSSPPVEARITVNITEAGTYYLWARVLGPHKDADALYVGIDELPMVRKFPVNVQVWEWLLVGVYDLTAGEHVLTHGHGEPQAQLDALYLTTDPTVDPPTP